MSNATTMKVYESYPEYIQDVEVMRDQEFIYNPEFMEKNNSKAREKEAQKSIIMSLISQFKPGMDLARFQAPVFLLKPTSFLESTSEYVCPLPFFVKISQEPSAEKRILAVAKWALCNSSSTPQKGFNRMKPYNPILGEQFYCKWDHEDSSSYFSAEQVSHHPPITALFMENRKYNWIYTSTTTPKSTFWGNKAEMHIAGEHVLNLLNLQEKYIVSWPSVVARGILLGTSCLELNGSARVVCEKTGFEAKIDFKKKKNNEVEGYITNANKEQLYKISGHVESKVNITDCKTNKTFLWFDGKNIPKSSKIVTPVANQQVSESRRVWHHLTNSIVNFNYDIAGKMKNLVEEHQRAITKQRKERGEEWKNKEFVPSNRKTADGFICYDYIKLNSASASGVSAQEAQEAISDLD